MMKKGYGTVCVLILNFLLPSCSKRITDSNDSNDPVSYPQKFHVASNKIVDESGGQVMFRGLAPIDPLYQYFASSESAFHDDDFVPWQERHFRTLSEWGTTIIRLGIEPATWRAHGKEKAFEILDQAVAWASKYEMYVMLDFHSIGFPPAEKYESNLHDLYGELYYTSREEIKAFWESISRQYASNNVVAFYELFNEPFGVDGPATPDDWQPWKAFAETVIDIIRKNDPDAVVIGGGLDHGYDLSQVLQNPIDRPDLVYATHPYPDKNKWGRNWDEAFGDVSAQYPVFATEFGFTPESEREYAGEGRYREAVFDYLESKKISWTAWCFSRNWTPALLRDNDYTPTEAGAFVRDKFQSISNGVFPK
ncbi:MAG: glycoside hydrolase family 5 protein [bacterium]